MATRYSERSAVRLPSHFYLPDTLQSLQFYPLKGIFNKSCLASARKLVIDQSEFLVSEIKHELFTDGFNFAWDEATEKWKSHPTDGQYFEKDERGPRNSGPLRQVRFTVQF